MDSSSCKNYQTHEINSRKFYEKYFSPGADEKLIEESIIFPIKSTFNLCNTGLIKGDVLIDLSVGATLYQLLPICKYFKNIIILELNESCVRDLQKWLNKEPDAFDWSHTAKIVAELEGNSDNWKGKEDDLRKRVKHILQCDLAKENPTDPVVLRKADCVFDLYLVGSISPDLEAFCHNLKKVSKMLKLGGRLLLNGAINGSFFNVGNHKYNIFALTEEDLKKALNELGFSIEHMVVMKSKIPNDFIHYEHVFFLCAVKEKEP